MDEPRPGDSGADALVVVPPNPGPLIRPDVPTGRGHDDLDELIDDLFPDSDEPPGWFDVSLLVIGLGLLGWGMAWDGPTVAVVVGAIAAALGCILPIRSSWRRFQRARRTRNRSAALARGIPLRLSDPRLERLVRAYESLLAAVSEPGIAGGPAAIAACHGAVIEVASLLRGRPTQSEGERNYADSRAAAIEGLTAVLLEQQAALPALADIDLDQLPDVEPAALLLARQEVDEIAGFSSLARLDELINEARGRRGTF